MKTIMVIGSTGQQGGSVLRYLYNDGTFNIRAMVRDVNSEKAQSLLKMYPNVTLVEGDLNDITSLENAMNGCYGVFGVTNFWDSSVGYDGEIRQGKNIGDACKNTNIQHLVYSTLEGNTGVAHLDSKSIAENYIRSLGVPMTALYTSAYFENVNTYFAPKDVDGRMVFSIAQKATTKVPMFSVYETGGWVLKSFLHPELSINKNVAAVSEYLTYGEVAETYGKVTGKDSVFYPIPLDIFRSFGFPGVHELADMLDFFDKMSEGTKTDVRKQLIEEQNNNALNFKAETFEEYLRRTLHK